MADGAGGATAQALALLQDAPDTQGEEVNRLVEQRRALQRQRAAVNNELRNVRRKQARIMEKAKGCTDSQLASIIVSRAAKAKAKGKAKARGG